MDEHLTDGYSEPCGQCSAVQWGVSDGGQFFCKNCHNVIERTMELDDGYQYTKTRITHVTKHKKTRKECAREWMVCEGFQFILKQQAEALVSLGVCSQFKTDVLWNFWMRYLQNTRQAFTKKKINTASFSVDLGLESETESVAPSETESVAPSETESVAPSETESVAPSERSVALSEKSVYSGRSSEAGETSASGYSSDGQLSVCSGSVDASSYVHFKDVKSRNLMTMPRTLALCYLALLWVREAITLADLLRLVSEGRVPYLNVHEHFPEEMKPYGIDATIFRVESLPSYSRIHNEAVNLAQVINLPSFPAVSQDCFLHPNLLTVRYLLECNLPDGLHVWVQKVIHQADMGDDSFLTFNPVRKKPHLLYYDIQAVAIIIVTMKLLFRLDDQVEWRSPQEVDNEKKKKKVFSLRRWFSVMQPAFEQARQKKERAEARKQWKSSKPLISYMKGERLTLKKRRLVENMQHKYQKLTDHTPEQQSSTTTFFSSFQFRWGKEEGSDGPSMHRHLLDCTCKKQEVTCLTNRKYWHTDPRPCLPDLCGDHFPEVEPTLPRMYVWLLDLFSFLLDVSQAQVHNAVVVVERRFLNRKRRQPGTETTFLCKKKKK